MSAGPSWWAGFLSFPGWEGRKVLIPFIQRGSTLIVHLSLSDTQFRQTTLFLVHQAHHWFHKPQPERIQDVQRGGKIAWQIMLYLKWITNKALLCSTWNSAQCYVPAWMGGGFGGEQIHVYVWLSSFAFHLKPSQHVNCLYPNIRQKV